MKQTTFEKRYGSGKKPDRKAFLHVLMRWQRLYATGCLLEEADKLFAALGYQGSFRECVEMTNMMIEAENARIAELRAVPDTNWTHAPFWQAAAKKG